MTYSKYFFRQNPKIPTVMTIGIVLLIIFFMARFFGTTSIPSRASRKAAKNLKIVNLSHNQTGIFWQTEEKETGWVIYGQKETNLDNLALDDRDLQEKRKLYSNHLVILKNLQTDSKYFYKIVGNDQLIESKNGQAFSFMTPANLSSTSSLNPVYGKIIRENGEPLDEAIVILNIDLAFPLATITKTTGEWLIPLNTLLNKKTSKIQAIKPEEMLTIEIFSEDKKLTQIISDLSHVSPLPQTIVVGNQYNFINQDKVLAATSDQNKVLKKTEILFPKESAIIPGGKPIIKGTAIPGNEVEITIESGKKYSFKTIADSDGVWSVVLSEELAPGSHTLKMITNDNKNKKIQITRKFIIAKSGEQVLAAATPEATPTLVETIMPTVTPFTTLSPTIFESPAATTSPSLSVSPPVSGINFLPISAASLSLIILGIGVLLAF